MKSLVSKLAAVAFVGSTLAGIGAASIAPAQAVCDANTYTSTPYVGRQVWIPTSLMSAWRTDGTIRRTESQGSSTSSTKGEMHEVTATGKVGAKVGPIGAEVTTTYHQRWNQSVTSSTSYRDTWSYTFKVPTDGQLWHARLYKLGRVFKYKTTHFAYPCTPITQWHYGAAPYTGNGSTKFYWRLENRKHLGDLRYDGLG
ncbi:hypothetical protein GCM10028801_34730 [Nocardioides maradonensis]